MMLIDIKIMSKYLGLDLGSNSIGWAVIDNTAKKTINYGIHNFNNTPSQKRIKRKPIKNKTIFILNILIGISTMFCIVSFEDWQFWSNVILTTFIAKITLSNQ